jgi:hypothetical protein
MSLRARFNPLWFVGALAVITLVIVLVVVRSGGSNPAPSALGFPATKSGPASITNSTLATGSYTGLGTTVYDWNVSHVPDKKFVVNAAYLPFVHNRAGAVDRYAGMFAGHGRVLGFTLNLSQGTSVADVERAVSMLLPADAVLTSGPIKHTTACAYLNYRSATLAGLLGRTVGDVGGTVGVELTTVNQNGTSNYDARDVEEAIVGLVSLDSTTTCQ